ncbi:hypothetical protein SeMB42_g01686 [Synchytrium endobioticum]|uniref:Uncharacterized protein n=1 Tax=Synchytrium endobioticum TaxID=286115 RepID=A0A507D2V1_9FUNG|nr:hypothetical protein SeLEV6574_g03754 [Synchytrium endobioticum]TPX52048.1 hypothetical protein SeMB42_g01686 [Synchytrium endobioticum]
MTEKTETQKADMEEPAEPPHEEEFAEEEDTGLTDDEKDVEHHDDVQHRTPVNNQSVEERTLKRWRFDAVRPEHFSFNADGQLVLVYYYQTDKNAHRSKLLMFESLSPKQKLQVYSELLLVVRDSFQPEVARYLQTYFDTNKIVLPKEKKPRKAKKPTTRLSTTSVSTPTYNGQANNGPMIPPITLKRSAAIAAVLGSPAALSASSSLQSSSEHNPTLKRIKFTQPNSVTSFTSTAQSLSAENDFVGQLELMDEEAVIEARVRMKMLYKQASRCVHDLVDQAKRLSRQGQNVLSPEEVGKLRLYDVNHACLNLAADLSGMSAMDFWPLNE